jgi:acyl-coenzyme A thioesterase PaaI-like protein
LPPFGRFLGAELVEVSANQVKVAMPTSEWFCRVDRAVSPGIIGMIGNLAIQRAILGIIQANERFVILHTTTTAMAPVVPDGRPLAAAGSVRHRRDDVIVAEAEVTDHDGHTVAIVQGGCLVRERGTRPRQRVAERVLLTLLFTDVVGSTERAQQVEAPAGGSFSTSTMPCFAASLKRTGGGR